MKHKLHIIALAALFVLGCNLMTNTAATRTATSVPVFMPTPGSLGFQAVVTVTPIPFQPTTTPLFGAQAAATLAPFVTPVFVPTLDPSLPLVTPETQNAIEWVLTQIVIPAWNFLYTLIINGVVVLWVYAGDRGGLTAQVCGCILPILIVGFLVIRSTLRRIRLV